MSSWILSICGVCVLSVIIDLILPDGQLNKYIKIVFSYIIVFILILPLNKVFNKHINIDDFNIVEDVIIDENYLYQLNQYKLDELKIQIEKDITNKSIIGVNIALSANIFENPMKIEEVYVDLYNLVIDENLEHINIEIAIIDSIKKYINIEKEKIFFNE